ncbi:MAG: TonB-dependent receptor [Anaerovibrio sp.]|uniref:TonB-dependent receptor plug domain-containing protein n=1 Tax=Anaerovibrio sp. TaxID=1872532 RepID=UPI001B1A67F6|nr:TonB-dependent receptor [Anaerovibrio sp.]MBO5588723.1 TonB-dependent receptor [Anaerovibrio sp.]MBO6246355.1 TonB-dependent receptor [Anaerovibrio sp.]
MQRDLKKMVLASLALGMLYSGTAVCQAEAVAQDDDIVDVVVTAERMPSSRMSTPADVTVITAEQIEDNHYSDVAEALQHVNGVVVNGGSGNGEQQVIINGDQRVVIMVDGQRLNNDQGVASGRASASLGMIPSVKNIERIEVVKGAGSALYGSDAVGGVVNIITKKGSKNETTIDLNTGSFGTHNYELTNQGSQGDWDWFVTAGIQKRGYFKYKAENGENVRKESSDYSKDSLSLRLGKKFSDSDSLRFMYTHRQQDVADFTRWDGTFHQNQNYNYGSITYNFKEDQPVQGFLRYGVNYKSTENNGHKFDTHSHDLEYQNGWQLGKNHKVVAGAEWHQSTSSNDQSGYNNKNITTQALFLQDTITLGDRWTFVPGVRMDHHSMFGTHWSPKAALNYQPTKQTRMYASWGRVFKAPTADDLYYTSVGYYTTLGNPDLKPESGHVETVGVTHEFSEKAVLDMSYFWSNLSNVIAWPEITTRTWAARNVNREKKHGINISLSGALSDRWAYEAGYSYVSTEYTDINARPYYEPNGYRLGVHYKCDRWKANLMGRFGSGLDDTNYGRNHYAIWDFNTSYAATQNVDIYFKINNLTNQMYYTVPTKQYPLQGRTFLVGANIKF